MLIRRFPKRYQKEDFETNTRASQADVKRSGKSARCMRVSKCVSKQWSSSDAWGRERPLVPLNSNVSLTTDFDPVETTLRAWIV